MLLTEVPKKDPNSRVLLTKTDDFSILLYSLLAVSMLLVFISLALALVAFLKGRRAKLRSTEPMEAPQNRPNCVVQPITKLDIPVGLATMSPNDIQTSPGSPPNCEQPDDSSPTETCVCVHCFPDLRTLGQDSQRPLRGPYSFYQQAVLHKANIPKSEPVCTEETIQSSGLRVQEEAYGHHKNI
ncbi:unnamed protein product [Menidia menidia]|uniref:(Atlantic silverside) hypothetical protein n=1 Tax=Menidia menidia TaxID=238744 RepID=A0A8S4B3W6_9TELE|nr:unnamed protein product [Menidia menidia]